MTTTIVQKAKEFGVRVHRETNHMYDESLNLPYSHHLSMVASWVRHFAHLLDPEDAEIAEAGAWVHDTIEDARQTYNDVKAVLGEQVAEIAFALTNEKGRTRGERANDRYYEGLRANPIARFVKICDRLANVEHSTRTGSKMKQIYQSELPEFRRKLTCEGDADPFRSMFLMIEQLLSQT